MKKLTAILLCFAICLAFAGCKNAEKETENAKEVLQKVLNHEESFYFKSLVFDKVTEENLEKFSFATEGSAINAFLPLGYAYVDFDGDGIEELLITEGFMHFFLILRYDNGKVNGYMLERLSAQDIHMDGSFLISYYKGPETVNRVKFDGLDCVMTELAHKDDAENTYELNGKTAAKEEVGSYIADWKSGGTQITWTTIEQK